MDEYGKDNNYAVKLICGLIIGLLLILFIVPLTANVIATQTVADVALDTLGNMNSSYDSSLLDSSSSIIPSVSESTPVNTQPSKTNQQSVSSDTKSQTSADISDMYIISGSITTGSSLSSRSSCSVYVGTQYAGSNVKISTLYSREGSNLNTGKIVPIAVDSNGYVTVKAADSYDLYPDYCLINLYDSNGNLLDSRSVSLATESGTQSF